MVNSMSFPLGILEFTAKILRYLGLADYFDIKQRLSIWRAMRKYGVRKYNNEYDFWISALAIDKRIPSIEENVVIELNDFSLCEWFPQFPGLFPSLMLSKSRDTQIREIGKKIMSLWNLEPSYEDVILGKRNFDDWHRKTMEVHALISTISHLEGHSKGMGAIRFLDHNGYHLLSAIKAGTSVANGVPLVVDTDAFEKVAPFLEKYGSASAKVKGIYSVLPERIRPLFKAFSWQSTGIPKCGIIVDRPNQLSNIEPGIETSVSVNSVVETNDKKYFLIGSSFILPGKKPRPELDLIRKADQIRDKTRSWHLPPTNQPLSMAIAMNNLISDAEELHSHFVTGVDEKVNWFPCQIEPGDVAEKRVDLYQIQKTIETVTKELHKSKTE